MQNEQAFCLAAPFGHHMVLQRDKPLVFWGRGQPGQLVEYVEVLGTAHAAPAGDDDTERRHVDVPNRSGGAFERACRAFVGIPQPERAIVARGDERSVGKK